MFQMAMSSNDKPRCFHILLIPKVSQQFSVFSKVCLLVGGGVASAKSETYWVGAVLL